MAITHKLNIKGLTKEQDGSVGHIHWEIVSTDGDITVNSYGSLKLKVSDSIPYGRVTEKMSVKWVQQHLTKEGIKKIESLNRRKLTEKKLQIEALEAGLPWEAPSTQPVLENESE